MRIGSPLCLQLLMLLTYFGDFSSFAYQQPCPALLASVSWVLAACQGC